jgi:hypothetical protein
VLLYLCRRQHDRVLVLLNLSKAKANFCMDHPAVTGSYTDLFTNDRINISRKKKFSFAPGEYKLLHMTQE